MHKDIQSLLIEKLDLRSLNQMSAFSYTKIRLGRTLNTGISNGNIFIYIYFRKIMYLFFLLTIDTTRVPVFCYR